MKRSRRYLNTNRPRRPIPLELELNLWDKQVDKYAREGFTAEVISKRTKLSISQVRYRTKEFGASALTYRRGESPEAKEKLNSIDSALREIQGIRRSISSAFRTRPAIKVGET